MERIVVHPGLAFKMSSTVELYSLAIENNVCPCFTVCDTFLISCALETIAIIIMAKTSDILLNDFIVVVAGIALCVFLPNFCEDT